MENQKIINLLNGPIMKIQNLQQKNVVLLIMNQKVIIHIKTQ